MRFSHLSSVGGLHMIPRVKAVKVAGPHSLHLVFDDGVRKRVNLLPLLEGPVFILGSEVVPDDVDRVLELVRHFALFRVCSLPGCRRGFVGKRKLDFCQGCEMRASEAGLAVHECSICCCDMHAISAHVLPCCKHRIHRSCADKCEACPYCRKRTHV